MISNNLTMETTKNQRPNKPKCFSGCWRLGLATLEFIDSYHSSEQYIISVALVYYIVKISIVQSNGQSLESLVFNTLSTKTLVESLLFEVRKGRRNIFLSDIRITRFYDFPTLNTYKGRRFQYFLNFFPQ